MVKCNCNKCKQFNSQECICTCEKEIKIFPSKQNSTCFTKSFGGSTILIPKKVIPIKIPIFKQQCAQVSSRIVSRLKVSSNQLSCPQKLDTCKPISCKPINIMKSCVRPPSCPRTFNYCPQKPTLKPKLEPKLQCPCSTCNSQLTYKQPRFIPKLKNNFYDCNCQLCKHLDD